MTDQELRTALLQQLYDQRSSRDCVQIGSDARVQSSEGHEQIRIAKQLADAGYIEFKMLNLHVGGLARIAGPGADVVEGATRPSTGMTVNVSNSSNVQIGQGNIQQSFLHSLHVMLEGIDGLPGTPEERAEAKGLLRQFWNTLL